MQPYNICLPQLPKTRQLTIEEEKQWVLLFKKKYGYNPVHHHWTSTPWIISTWKSDEVPELKEFQRSFTDRLAKNPRATDSKQFDFLNKLWEELKNTSRKTTILPVQEPSVRLNVLTLGGMEEMAKRSTGDSTSTNSHMNIGTGVTTEDESDDVTYSNSLQTQSARVVMGSKAAVDQQERYSAAVDDGDVTGEPLAITEAGINTHATAGVQIARVTFAAQTLDIGYTMAFQALVNHRNGAEA